MRYRAEKRASRVSRVAAIGIGPLVEALLLLWVARLGLWLLPFKTVWPLMAAVGRARWQMPSNTVGRGTGPRRFMGGQIVRSWWPGRCSRRLHACGGGVGQTSLLHLHPSAPVKGATTANCPPQDPRWGDGEQVPVLRHGEAPMGALGPAVWQGEASLDVPDPEHEIDAQRLVRAIAVAARIVPRATCLVKAQALHAMLARRHGRPTIGIGVAKGDDGRLEAHAWVELDGRVILGGQMPARYQPILYLSGEPI